MPNWFCRMFHDIRFDWEKDFLKTTETGKSCSHYKSRKILAMYHKAHCVTCCKDFEFKANYNV